MVWDAIELNIVGDFALVSQVESQRFEYLIQRDVGQVTGDLFRRYAHPPQLYDRAHRRLGALDNGFTLQQGFVRHDLGSFPWHL